jgi:hypothetical protein
LIYKAKKVKDYSVLNGGNATWNYLEKASLINYMGEKPKHFPIVTVQIAYSESSLYARFIVLDKFIKCVNTTYQSDVWKDSCIEIFFIPGLLKNDGYFNLEINCGGTALFNFQKAKGVNVIPIDIADFKELEIYHSLPIEIREEIEGPLKWEIAIKLPFKILKKYYDFSLPISGSKWFVNFYKCADETSNPHWITWTKVKNARPDFHLPQYFGELYFE